MGLLLYMGIQCTGCNVKPGTLVRIENGKIEGSYNDDESIRIFKGIPFAAPPTGDLRWQAPRPVQSWEGVRPCTEYGPSPVQNKPEPFYCWTEEFIAKPEPLSEDCLYLNIWTSARSQTEKQPVFVWIYGGGLVSGSSNCDIYDGEEMAKKGVVFVSINYRVGVFGFMAHPGLTEESGYHASGNYGFLDQIAALGWIRDNILAFGGDPDNVTIAGQSAGAFSVHALIASALAKGLFNKAILQSGGLFSNRLMQNLEEAEQAGLHFMEVAGVNSLDALRAMPAEQILALGNDSAVGRFGVTLDNYVLPVDLLAHFEQKLHNHVPIMAGWVTGDGALMGQTEMTLAQYMAAAESQYGDRATEFLSIFPAATDEEVRQMNSKLAMLNFAGITVHMLSGFNSHPTFVYEFGHLPPDKPDFPNYGAFHTSEVPFVLHTLHAWNRPWRTVDEKIENWMSSYWAHFARTGNPNGEDLPEWKMYDKISGHILMIGDTILLKEGYMKEAFDFLEAWRF